MVATINGSGSFDIKAALTNEIIGGRLDLRMQVSNTVEKVVPFFIRGKNPLDAIARAYIDANVDEEFRSYAWMIAKHESKLGDRVYNQFNPSGSRKELPNWGSPDGWGMCQIDRSANAFPNNVVNTSEVYNWKTNVLAMCNVLRDKRNRYEEVIRWFRTEYQNDHSTQWFEPDNVKTNIGGAIITARQWSIMTFYNGAGGCPYLPFQGHDDEPSPIHFDPVTTNWVLYTNVHDYVPTVLSDSMFQDLE